MLDLDTLSLPSYGGGPPSTRSAATDRSTVSDDRIQRQMELYELRNKRLAKNLRERFDHDGDEPLFPATTPNGKSQNSYGVDPYDNRSSTSLSPGRRHHHQHHYRSTTPTRRYGSNDSHDNRSTSSLSPRRLNRQYQRQQQQQQHRQPLFTPPSGAGNASNSNDDHDNRSTPSSATSSRRLSNPQNRFRSTAPTWNRSSADAGRHRRSDEGGGRSTAASQRSFGGLATDETGRLRKIYFQDDDTADNDIEQQRRQQKRHATPPYETVDKYRPANYGSPHDESEVEYRSPRTSPIQYDRSDGGGERDSAPVSGFDAERIETARSGGMRRVLDAAAAAASMGGGSTVTSSGSSQRRQFQENSYHSEDDSALQSYWEQQLDAPSSREEPELGDMSGAPGAHGPGNGYSGSDEWEQDRHGHWNREKDRTPPASKRRKPKSKKVMVAMTTQHGKVAGLPDSLSSPPMAGASSGSLQAPSSLDGSRSNITSSGSSRGGGSGPLPRHPYHHGQQHQLVGPAMQESKQPDDTRSQTSSNSGLLRRSQKDSRPYHDQQQYIVSLGANSGYVSTTSNSSNGSRSTSSVAGLLRPFVKDLAQGQAKPFHADSRPRLDGRSAPPEGPSGARPTDDSLTVGKLVPGYHQIRRNQKFDRSAATPTVDDDLITGHQAQTGADAAPAAAFPLLAPSKTDTSRDNDWLSDDWIVPSKNVKPSGSKNKGNASSSSDERKGGSNSSGKAKQKEGNQGALVSDRQAQGKQRSKSPPRVYVMSGDKSRASSSLEDIYFGERKTKQGSVHSQQQQSLGQSSSRNASGTNGARDDLPTSGSSSLEDLYFGGRKPPYHQGKHNKILYDSFGVDDDDDDDFQTAKSRDSGVTSGNKERSINKLLDDSFGVDDDDDDFDLIYSRDSASTGSNGDFIYTYRKRDDHSASSSVSSLTYDHTVVQTPGAESSAKNFAKAFFMPPIEEDSSNVPGTPVGTPRANDAFGFPVTEAANGDNKKSEIDEEEIEFIFPEFQAADVEKSVSASQSQQFNSLSLSSSDNNLNAKAPSRSKSNVSVSATASMSSGSMPPRCCTRNNVLRNSICSPSGNDGANENPPARGSLDKETEEPAQSDEKRSWCCWFLFAAAITALIGAAGVVLLIRGFPEAGEPGESLPTAPPTRIEDAMADDDERQDVLVLPTYRLDALLVLLAHLSGDDVLQDRATPQQAAIEWLANKDPAQLDLAETPLSTLMQRYVVVLLYFATTGIEWDDQHNFLASSPVCGWNLSGASHGSNDGIVCDEDGEVVQIVLPDNNLGGSIPWEIATLDRLQVLYLPGNKIIGEIPTQLGLLAGLRHLGLTSNSFEGTLPSQLGMLTSIRHLDVGSNRFEGTLPTECGNLGNLQVMSVGSNLLGGSLPSELGRLTNLRHLSLNANRFTGTVPVELGSLSLDLLNLRSNRFRGDLDDAFCVEESHSRYHHGFWADCAIMDGIMDVGTTRSQAASILATSPQESLTCSCCTYCCHGQTCCRQRNDEEDDVGGDQKGGANATAVEKTDVAESQSPSLLSCCALDEASNNCSFDDYENDNPDHLELP